MTTVPILIASGDEHFREMVRENLLNTPGAQAAAEYLEVSPNLYIRVLQDLERSPQAALVLDLAGDPEAGLRALEKTKQAAPDLYVIASNYHADGETVIAALRAGANDFIVQPLKRLEFRDAIARLERAPRRAAGGTSKLGKVYTFVGTKGGVGATSLAVNFAAIQAQRQQSTVLIDLDWIGNDCAMQVGVQPQYTLHEVAENLSRLDQALFEGLVTRDPLGFYLVGPPDSFEQRGFFSEHAFREFAGFLVEKYDCVVIDGGRAVADEVVLSACQVSTLVFLVCTQQFPAIRNAQRYLAYLLRTGFTAEQIKVVVNRYEKKPNPHHATLEQIQQALNQSIFYGIPPSPAMLAAVNRARPAVADRQAAGDLDRVLRAFADKATGARPQPAKTA